MTGGDYELDVKSCYGCPLQSDEFCECLHPALNDAVLQCSAHDKPPPDACPLRLGVFRLRLVSP